MSLASSCCCALATITITTFTTSKRTTLATMTLMLLIGCRRFRPASSLAFSNVSKRRSFVNLQRKSPVFLSRYHETSQSNYIKQDHCRQFSSIPCASRMIDSREHVCEVLSPEHQKEEKRKISEPHHSSESHQEIQNSRQQGKPESKAIGALSLCDFQVTSSYEPTGDQPQAIAQLVKNLQRGDKYSVLRGATGTGKTFVLSHVISRINRPTLVLCHNKTLAAQLARELRSLLSRNAVELFVSYYDYYTPESYVETTGRYIAKKSSINAEIDALRHRATRALVERKDVVVVASVSCIYGLGLPKEYVEASVLVSVSNTENNGNTNGGASAWTAHDLIASLKDMLYTQVDDEEDIVRGNYALSSSSPPELQEDAIVTVWPPHERHPIYITFDSKGTSFIKSISQSTDHGNVEELPHVHIYPARHHVTSSSDTLDEACQAIEEELSVRYKELVHEGKALEAQRLQQRVTNDLLLLRETGTCSGVENYSRHFAGRKQGDPPDTLMDYFGWTRGGKVGSGDGGEKDWLLVVDESHVTLPQLKAMYGGDQARKHRIIKHGFRLPSALDNRPLQDTEFWERVHQAVFVSATPSATELKRSQGPPVDMMIRPTFICDPVIDVRPPENQLVDLMAEIQKRAARNERTLAMALTKRDAEDLATFLERNGDGIRSTYIHSDLTTVERADAIRSLQRGEVDCLVGVNLLREGLDMPQVSLVAILNADSEGFLRSETALLQVVGRAARNVNGAAIFYAKRVTDSMRACMNATELRRKKQMEYNAQWNTTPRSALGSETRSIFDLLREEGEMQPMPLLRSDTQEKFGVNSGSSLPLPGGNVDTMDEWKSLPKLSSDHFPTKPGVYCWKDDRGTILYVGKAKNLRKRLKTYLSPSASGRGKAGSSGRNRIEAMLSKAVNVDFMITPSERDALMLESNLIKELQPPYNVLLKDDVTYPYICASVGDVLPRFFAVPRKVEGANTYRYFGPYPHYNEINKVLQLIEEKYDLRGKSFAARHGGGDEMENRKSYVETFYTALDEVFRDGTTTITEDGAEVSESWKTMRSRYEEAALLFDSDYNLCRDVVAVVYGEDVNGNGKGNLATVFVVQLRSGSVAGSFAYPCLLPSALEASRSNDTSLQDEDLSNAVLTVLEKKHYASAEEGGLHTFFPQEILTQYPLADKKCLRDVIRSAKRAAQPANKNATRGSIAIRSMAKRGPRRYSDERAMSFAIANAEQRHFEYQQKAAAEGDDETGTSSHSVAIATSLDGTASKELANLLSLDRPPARVECFDISHNQGQATVGSRVVFIDGKPAKHLYRIFNLKTLDDGAIDDYASITEVMERRFRRAWANDDLVDDGDEWTLPDLVVVDGGKGQLGAAVSGMAKAEIYPRQASQETNSDELDPEAILEEHVERNDSLAYPTERMAPNQHNVAVCALAKNKEELFAYGQGGEPLSVPTDTPALLLLRAIRDESHRFALTAHRRRRARQGGFR